MNKNYFVKGRTMRGFFLLAAFVAGLAVTNADSVYSRVYDKMMSYDNRIVGSVGVEESFKAIEAELRAAGLEPKYQTYESLVQKTEYCKFMYDGKLVDGALMMDNGIAPFVLDKPLEGRVVYVGNGSVKDIDGLELKDSIAILDATLEGVSLSNVYMHGAKAIIVVADESIDQWRLAKCDFKSISLAPRLFLHKSKAKEYGLLSADGSKKGSIDAKSTIVDASAKNLWVELPSKGYTGNLSKEEVVVLSARVDTYGITPDYCPESRFAANAALLADVVCELAKGEPLNRKVIAMFFGAHYSGQEGARFLYHVVDMSDTVENSKGFAERAKDYDLELKTVEDMINIVENDNVITNRSEYSLELQTRLKKEIIGTVATQRSFLGELKLQRRNLEGSDKPEDKAKIAEIDEIIAKEDAKRAVWNELRRLVVNRQYVESEEVKAAYDEMISKVLYSLKLRHSEIVKHIANNNSWIELEKIFKSRAFVGHYDFDFADAVSPWAFSCINAHGLYRFEKIDTGTYLRFYNAFDTVYYGDKTGDDPTNKGISDGKDWKAMLYKPALSPTFKPYSLSVPNQRSVPSAVSAGLGLPGFQMISVGNNLAHDALPFNDEVDLESLKDQMVEMCATFGNSEKFSMRLAYNREKMEDRFIYSVIGKNAWKGVNFLDYAPASTDNDGVPHNSIMQFNGGFMTEPQVGLSKIARTRILANGYVYMPMISRDAAVSIWLSTAIGVGYDNDGKFERVSLGTDSTGVINKPIHMFYAYGGKSFSNGYPPDPVGGDMYEAKTMIASKDAKHKTSASYKVEGSKDSEFFADKNDPIKVIGANGDMILGSKLNESGSSVDLIKDAMGRGIPLDAEFLLNFDGIAQGANDAYILNEVRLRTLRQRNIVRDDLEKLHADAKDHLEEADKLYSEHKWSEARAHQVFATCIESRVYNPLRNVTEDLVQAVVLLLLLNIPFAFAMERLIFGFTLIYKQLMGFCIFFLATFGILFFTHPAFALASAPTIIFLAFVIILLSVVTTAIMMGKIKQEIKAIQGLSSTVHGMESENSTKLSAILIGIAGMRNRPLKTFLTCITVVLLTFTILVFASFTSQQGIVETYLGRGQNENRIELHRLSLLGIDRTLVESVETLYGDRFDIYRRGGLFRNPLKGNDLGVSPLSPESVVYCPSTGKMAVLNAILGLDDKETKHNAELNAAIPNFESKSDAAKLPPMFLPKVVADKLEVEEGGEILLNGISFEYCGLIDGVKLQNMSTLDDLKVVLPDFQATIKNTGGSSDSQQSMEFMEQIPLGSFEWMSPDVIAVARISDLINVIPNSSYVTYLLMYPKNDDIDIESAARSLAPVFHGTVHSKSAEGVRYMYFTKAVEGSGFADVIVPLLLGGLIIFSSLMGSIVDREKEIFTYSALGLSPPNVGALFFAESAVYSVIGGMGGYLLSQVIAKLFTWMGRMGWMTPPEMNFSSLTSVCTILIVMAVVMLSTIFPALRASKSANPGVARKWSMPSPTGDLMKFVFPFTVSEVDFTGILSFIREHFNNHRDATLGSFAAQNVKLFKIKGGKGDGKDAYGIEADVSLAPFDLGVFQKFKMYSSEFEIKGIDEVVVEINRMGGTPTSWIRSNRAFADELRKQFLLWRSLPIETIEHYRNETHKTLDENVSKVD